MPTIFWVIFIFIILQRLGELVIAKQNEKWMKERGGVEWGSDHYKWFVLVHLLFFASILFEVFMGDPSSLVLHPFLFGIFLIVQLARVWCILSLGRFWNTKIIILPNARLVRRGPYKYVKHPNSTFAPKKQ